MTEVPTIGRMTYPAPMGGSTAARATLIGLGAIGLWAGLAVLTVLTAGIPPFQLLGMSFGVAFLSGISLLAWRGRSALRELRQPIAPWLTAFVGIFGYHALYYYALKAAPAAEANLIQYLWPLLIVLFAALLPGQGLQARHVAGAALGLCGTALLVAGGGGTADAAAPVAGYAAALGCALLWSGYSVLNRRYAGTPSTMLVGVCGAVALGGFVLHLLVEATVIPNLKQSLAAVMLGLGPTGLAFLAWDHATKHGHIALLGALSYLAPLLSTALLVIIGAAPATSRLALCALLIVGGAGLAASAGWRKKSG